MGAGPTRVDGQAASQARDGEPSIDEAAGGAVARAGRCCCVHAARGKVPRRNAGAQTTVDTSTSRYPRACTHLRLGRKVDEAELRSLVKNSADVQFAWVSTRALW